MDHTVNKYFPSLFIAEHSYEIETLFSFYRLYKEKIKTEGQFRWKNRDIQEFKIYDSRIKIEPPNN